MNNPSVASLYQTFEQGRTPSAALDGFPQRLVATSQRPDVVVAERVDGTETTYDLMRIESANESNSQQIQRHVRSGGRQPPGRPQFDHCEYQLKHVELPEMAEADAHHATRLITDAGLWKRNVTPIRTASTAQALQRAWDEWKAGKR